MGAERVARVAGKCAFVALLAAALWFRVDGLNGVPWFDADEAYEGVVLSKLLHGEPTTLRTTSGNLLDPFFLALEAPFQLLLTPAPVVLRAPAVISGVLAVVLAYVLGSWVLDRGTAAIAATVLATLPAAVIYSRIGHEYSQIPLIGVIAIFFAMRGRAIGLGLTLLAGLLVHPITVFLAPVTLPVLLTQVVRQNASDPVRLRRVVIATAATAGLGVVGLLAVLWRNPVVQHWLHAREPMDWITFLQGIEKFLLFEYSVRSKWLLTWHHWLFWGPVLLVADLGLRRLARDRQWERLALAAGLAAALTMFHAVAGPKLLVDAGPNRYGVVFLAPIALTFACVAQSLFAQPGKGEEGRSKVAYVRGALLLAVGWGMLLSVKTHYLDGSAGRKPPLWRVQTVATDPFGSALALILRDAQVVVGSESPPCEIVAQEYWDSKPLEFLAFPRREVAVKQLVSLEDLARSSRGDRGCFVQRAHEAAESLVRGAYIVAQLDRPYGHGGKVVEAAVASAFAPGQVHRWIVPGTNNRPFLAVYRLERPVTPATAQADPFPRHKQDAPLKR
jgi:hypothetical protein